MTYSALPSEVKERGLFCCWRLEERNGKPTKVPYDPMTGNRAQSNDPTTFATFDNACSYLSGYSGLGIGIFNGICAIDLDDCITDSGYYKPDAAVIIEMMHSYTELSPSGNGVHILFLAENFQYNKERHYIMNHKAGVEVYVAGATSKYVTVTGKALNDLPVEDRTEELTAVLEIYMLREQANRGRNGINGINAPNGANPDLSNDGINGANGINPSNGANPSLEDDALLDKALHCRSGAAFGRLWSGSTEGYLSQSEADMALCSQLAFWTGRDADQMDRLFRRSGLMRDKWDRRQSGTTYGALTIQRAIQDCRNIYEPKRSGKIGKSGNDPPEFAPIQPLKPEKSQLPTFPVDCLPPVIGGYVRAVAAHSQTSVDMAAVISLGVLAVCTQGKFLVEGTAGYFEPLSLYVVVIASPGERKSGVMRDMTRVIYQYEQEYNAQQEPAIRSNRQKRELLQRKISGLEQKLERSSGEELELELRDLQNQLEDLPEVRPLRLFADDCSSEALTSLLANNGGRFAVISTEGGIFDIMAGRYSSKSNLDVWLKGHCGDAIRVDRLGREAEYIPHPALSAILTIQPSVLDDIMSNDAMSGRGLLARFFYACPQSTIGRRVFSAPPIPAEISEAYQRRIYELLNLSTGERPVILNLSPKATDIISDYFQEHERFLLGEGQAISDWASKYIGGVLRIAGLLHVAEDSDQREISAETMRKAIQIGSYFLAHSGYAYSMMGTDLTVKKAAFVLAKLRKEQVQTIKRSELLRMCRGKFFKKVEDIVPTLELLESHNYLRLEEPMRTTAGRPPDWRVVVNPAALQEVA